MGKLCEKCGADNLVINSFCTQCKAGFVPEAKEAALCPLCETEKISGRLKLYGSPVGRKCCNVFAVRRQAAYLVDGVVFQLFHLAVFFGLAVLGRFVDIVWDKAGPWHQLLSYLASSAYFLVKDGFSGYSPGKLLMGVRVIDTATGAPAGFRASIKRNLPTLIPVIPLYIAFQLKRGKRLGDKWAKTKVIWDKHRDTPLFAVMPLYESESEPQAAAQDTSGTGKLS